MKQKINLIFVLLFSFVISLPYLFAHRDREGRVSDMENRTLTGYPAVFEEDGNINKEFTVQYENWLNDNLRGRSILVEANAAVQYLLFQKIVKNDVLQGEDGWLFSNDAEQIAEYQHSNLMTEEELFFYASKMQRLSEYLEERNINFYYMQCYAKEMIYSDKYNKGILQTEDISRTEQIISMLKEKTDICVIDTKKILEDAGIEESVYFQYADLVHWNEAGAYLGYRALMDEIQKDYKEIPILKIEDYDISQREQSTSIYGFEYPYMEICPVYNIKEPKALEMTADAAENWNWLHYKEYTHLYYNEDSSNKKILVLGDSYVRMFIKDDIAESFSRTLSIDRANISILDKILESYHPGRVPYF